MKTYANAPHSDISQILLYLYCISERYCVGSDKLELRNLSGRLCLLIYSSCVSTFSTLKTIHEIGRE
ncbi:hypothetical protein T07_14925 [Trichinella nelsoni]|uniref:Uncharacterized protein n=1 Tax=Trichinella nelsoni TaxID=6336 RepID=A0A0V0S5N4_9BILA|nr:hypothetical protein T07_14925 [Trichinella nelsoni]